MSDESDKGEVLVIALSVCFVGGGEALLRPEGWGGEIELVGGPPSLPPHLPQ